MVELLGAVLLGETDTLSSNRISKPTPLSMLEFGLPRACVGLAQACVYCHNHCEFTHAAALPCPEDTV